MLDFFFQKKNLTKKILFFLHREEKNRNYRETITILVHDDL